MNEIILLVLRLVAAGSLLGFLGGVAYTLQRDIRLTAEQVQGRKQVRGRLVVLANAGGYPPLGAALPLSPSTTLGRAPTNTIPIDDTYLSSEHARVVQRLGQWWLEDQHSSNGTLLNGIPIHEPVVLSAGDVIGVGSLELRLELD